MGLPHTGHSKGGESRRAWGAQDTGSSLGLLEEWGREGGGGRGQEKGQARIGRA